MAFCVIALLRLCSVRSSELPANSAGWLVAFRSGCELPSSG